MIYDDVIKQYVTKTKNVRHPAICMAFDDLYLGVMEEYHKGTVNIKSQYIDGYELQLFNYFSPKIYEFGWNKYNILARGLVLCPELKEIVAIPYPKFFNMFELEQFNKDYFDNTIKNDNFDFSFKEDGSLGIIYHFRNKWYINTRGSFNSEQSIRMQPIINDIFNHEINNELKDKVNTLLCEIIYPENRIVMDYGDFDGIKLISYYDNDGYEHLVDNGILPETKLVKIPDDKLKEYDHKIKYSMHSSKLHNNINDCIKWINNVFDNIPSGKVMEGYVIRFSNGVRVKIKSDEYFKLHKIVSNLTDKCVFEIFKDNFTEIFNNNYLVDDIINNYFPLVPEEYVTDIRLMIERIISNFSDIFGDIVTYFDFVVDLNPNITKKEYNLNLQTGIYNSILTEFLFLENSNYINFIQSSFYRFYDLVEFSSRDVYYKRKYSDDGTLAKFVAENFKDRIFKIVNEYTIKNN
jgi:RNA ligase